LHQAKRIYCTVTNELSYDQRMTRICSSLAAAGYRVTLIGRSVRGAPRLEQKSFRQYRISLFFQKGKLFYLEYNIRLFFYLLFRRADLICAVDLDSILPVYLVSALRGIYRVYDAHELFCEMKEVVSRPGIYKFWKKIEGFAVPAFRNGYTVSQPIAREFQKMYANSYEDIRNMPVLGGEKNDPGKKSGTMVTGKFVLYQGAVNEGRCFESLIPAMQSVEASLVICGNGNFLTQARELVKRHQLEAKVIFKGAILPEELRAMTREAWCGVTLFDRTGKSNYFSLANRFFDYMHAGIPQLAMNYPAYQEINNLYPIAVLIDEPSIPAIADALNGLMRNNDLHHTLQENCKKARRIFNWQHEEKKLLHFYKQILT